MGASHEHHHHGHHGHGHAHAHEVDARVGRAFGIGIALNLAYVAIEAGIGFWQGSLALLADAGHNLSDVLGLALAWGAATLGRTAPSARYTYGLRSTTIWAALVNALLLLVACGAIALEAVRRFGSPTPIEGGFVAAVAAVGIVINAVTAWLFMRDRKRDLNVRGAYLHMVADAAVSLGVVVSGLLIMATGWQWLDPATSLAIVAAIFIGTWGLLRDSLRLALQAVPRGIDSAEVRRYLGALEGVTEVHDLHIWSMSTTETALTAHLVMPGGHPGDAFLGEIAHELEERYRISHATLQIEVDDADVPCRLAPDHVV
jgi:cobalt-zinc-cadmium efflux system protein